jgi:hypothetical protein
VILLTDGSLPDDLSQWPADPHKLFGIGPTADMRDLRRAYAALIRRFKPEHHPRQFRRIRDAYESLEWQVRWRERGPTLEPEDVDDEIAQAPSDEVRSVESGAQHQNNPPPSTTPAIEPTSIERPQAEDNIDLVWSRVIRHGGDWQIIYRQLVHATERATTDEVLFCRLYWLLTVAPHADSERKPVEWLAAGLARNTSTPRLMSLYFQELNRRPQEALRERSRVLLTQDRPTWQLAELARHRWRALRVLDRLEEIDVDQRLLRGPFISAREEWVQLLMTAVEVLVWSNGEAVAIQLGECLREIEQMTDVQLGLAVALDRHELLLELAGDYRRDQAGQYDHLDFPKGLLQLLPELWLNSDVGQLRLVEILGSWVDHPEIALDGLESLNQMCRVTLSYFTDLLTSLAPRDHEDNTAGARRRSIEHLVETHEWRIYRACREQLCQYCLRTGVWLDEILDVMHTDPRYADLADGTASSYLREDLPLKCLLAGHRAFWR